MKALNKLNIKFPYLDVLRTFATYSVILLHCIVPYMTSSELFGHEIWWLCNLINSVVRTGVPLFFMISGFLLLRDSRTLDMKIFYKKRFSKLIIPFLFWDIFYFVTTSIKNGRTLTLSVFLKELFNQGSKYHLWFIYQILGIYLLAPFLKRIVDNCTYRQLFLLLVIILTPTTFFRLINVLQPYITINIWKPLVEGYVGFFVLGYILGHFEISKQNRILAYCGGAFGFLIGVCGNFLVSSPESMSLVFNEGYAVNHYLTSGALFILAKHLPSKIQQSLGDLVRPISSVSLGIYFVHVFVMSCVSSLSHIELPVLVIFLKFVSVSLISTVIMIIASKIKIINRIVL